MSVRPDRAGQVGSWLWGIAWEAATHRNHGSSVVVSSAQVWTPAASHAALW
jgi:hypothetical protein